MATITSAVSVVWFVERHYVYKYVHNKALPTLVHNTLFTQSIVCFQCKVLSLYANYKTLLIDFALTLLI